MIQRLSETCSELLHYTTVAGLQGIVESQQLWATNISYLNDAEEHTGFFDRRLPHLLQAPIQKALDKFKESDFGKKYLEAVGGIDNARKDLATFAGAIRSVTLKFNAPYVTSFCRASSPEAAADGLLSQWRGYGVDGGYAIVFETVLLEKLLDEESKRFNYQSLRWGDVEYYDQDSSQQAAHPETVEWEQAIQDAYHKFLVTRNQSELDAAFEPVTALSCLHKHRGFREEAEVRIVAIPANPEVFEASQNTGDKRPQKPIHFVTRSSVLVPYIKLFGTEDLSPNMLPITRVIVGPHPDRLKRQKAVALMLEQHEIDAEVTISDIPYLGR